MAGRTMAKGLTGRSQRLVFLTGVLLAAVAAVLVFLIASSSGGGSGDRVPVVTAAQDIPAGTRVTSDMLQVSFVGADEAQDGVFSSRSQVIDRQATDDITSGSQVVTDSVTSSTGDGVAYLVEPGHLAISVEVKEVVTAGGNLKPGDYVDVIGVFEVPDVQAANHLLAQLGFNYKLNEPPAPPQVSSDGTEEKPGGKMILTVTLLQNVRLLAIAQSLTEVSAGGTPADQSNDAEAKPKAATATLELTPVKARDITTADEYGKLRMGARAAGDDEFVDVGATLVRIDRAQ